MFLVLFGAPVLSERVRCGRLLAAPAPTCARLIELLLDHNDAVDDGVWRDALCGIQAVVKQGNDVVHRVWGGEAASEHVVAGIGRVCTAIELACIEDGAQGIWSLTGLGLGRGLP